MVYKSEIERIASKFFTRAVSKVEKVINLGSVNKVYIASSNRQKIVIRVNEKDGLRPYQKEAWCINKSSDAGIPGPQVIDMGKEDTLSYMAISFIEGLNGKKYSDQIKIWRALGEYARRIHSIPLDGFPDTNVPPEGFDRSWENYVIYNFQSLNPADKLLEIGAISVKESEWLKEVFSDIKTLKFKAGLVQGDLCPRNTIVNVQGEIFLIDWGSADSGIVPFGDLIEILKSSTKSTSANFASFLEGYDMTQNEFLEIKSLLSSLMLLRATDKLRWSIDKMPDKTPHFVRGLRKAIKQKLSESI